MIRAVMWCVFLCFVAACKLPAPERKGSWERELECSRAGERLAKRESSPALPFGFVEPPMVLRSRDGRTVTMPSNDVRSLAGWRTHYSTTKELCYALLDVRIGPESKRLDLGFPVAVKVLVNAVTGQRLAAYAPDYKGRIQFFMWCGVVGDQEEHADRCEFAENFIAAAMKE